MQSSIPLMKKIIPQKNALRESELKLRRVVRPKKRITGTTKHSNKRVIRRLIENLLMRRNISEKRSGKFIDEIHSCMESIPPKTYRKFRLSKQSQTNLNNVLMFPLHKAILLMYVRTRVPKDNSKKLKKFMNSHEFTPPPIRMKNLYFHRKLSFNHMCELNCQGCNLSLDLKRINLCKSGALINKRKIISKPLYREYRSRTPHISMHHIKRFRCMIFHISEC